MTYLSSTTRPDTGFFVDVLSRYAEDPTITLWKVTLHVIRYVNRARKMRMSYCAKDGLEHESIDYCYADFGGNWSERKSTLGLVFKIARLLE